MNLLSNPKWSKTAKKLFSINDQILIKDELCTADYMYKNPEGNVILFGFDFPDDTISEKQIFSALLKEKETKHDDSLIHKMFKFFDYGNSPLVFMVTKQRLFYMPAGIRQIQPFVWESTEDLSTLIKISNHF
jgi:hypothetical protein